MKFTTILPLAALSSAIVLPSEQVLGELAIEDHHADVSYDEPVTDRADDVFAGIKHVFDDLTATSKSAWHQISHSAGNALDDALSQVNERVEAFGQDLESWCDDADIFDVLDLDGDAEEDDVDALDEDERDDAPPHRGPPRKGKGPHHGPPRRGGRPGRGRRPHHPPHHGKPNQTIYQLISESKYTTKFAKLISEYDEFVEVLNGTTANHTLFVPTDKAFEKIPEHAPKPSKEQLAAIISYHIVPALFPAARVLASHTAPTLLYGELLGEEPLPQRLAFKFGLRGLTVNFYSRIVAVNIFGTNGVIHGVDSFILPPPKAVKILDLFPGEFSTLELGLSKTGLLEDLIAAERPGGTLFAPTNFAFKKLGPRINAFLFSKFGAKYLTALLKYHVAPSTTLYSDALYKAKDADSVDEDTVPKGRFHIDLPTLLKERSLSIDVARFARFIDLKINGFTSVAIQDVIARDGVVHIVKSVLIPPKTAGAADEEFTDGSDLTVEEFMARLEPYVSKTDL